MLLTSRQRAFDAQVALYGTIAATFKNRNDIAEALCSAISTGQVALRNADGGIAVSHGHHSLPEVNPDLWDGIEGSVWNAVYAGHAPGGIWGEIETQLKKIGLDVAAISDVATAHAAKQPNAA